MLLLEKLISLYAPYVCLGCGTECNTLLCENCLAVLPAVPSRCYRCRAVTREYAVCAACRPYVSLRAVGVARYYDDMPKELLHRAKYERARSGLSEIAQDMAALLRFFPKDVVLVPVPTASGRVRQRGYDQAVVLAKELARRHSIPVAQVLVRLGQAHQVGSGRKERLAHLKNAFRVVKPVSINKKHCVLVDDVLTTGATLETAARILKKAGAKRVDAIVYAQAGT
ncbi:hypothetical protein CSA80_03740 [Candidatus Saccharibacteria bacterium]|nr:MAG: hypothetical protein CR973_01230 [Candidatus Saccharibacteria bacterium]PID99197.1 MAG: hypothetical protein CSA80_03740 [Candidatus Saccharibacteria bacterium]